MVEVAEDIGQRLGTWWEQALRNVLVTMGAAETLGAAQIGPGDLAAWQRWDSPVWHRLVPDKIPGASLSVGCPQSTMQALAGLLAGDIVMSEAEFQPTFVEVLNQIATGAGDAISGQIGKLVLFAGAEPAAAPDAGDQAVELAFTVGAVNCVMALAPDEVLRKALTTPAAPAPARPPGTGGGLPATAAPTNLDLLLEVELPVSVTFGRTQLPLKDVLKLSAGSIVELNRLAHEPVEVVVNNCVVARGEVVVVEGNYGVRITEIMSRQERIRSVL